MNGRFDEKTTPPDIASALNLTSLAYFSEWCHAAPIEKLIEARKAAYPHLKEFHVILDNEISGRQRIEDAKISKERHQEALRSNNDAFLQSMKLGRETLKWAKIAGWVSIASVG